MIEIGLVETGSASRPQHHSVKPVLHRDCLCHIKASPGLAGREGKEPPAGSSTATATATHTLTHATYMNMLITFSIRLQYVSIMGTKLAPSTLPFHLAAVSLWCVFGPRKGCIDEPSLTFNEASSDELALESYCRPLPPRPNKVLMRTFPKIVPKALSFLTASQTESIPFFHLHILKQGQTPVCRKAQTNTLARSMAHVKSWVINQNNINIVSQTGPLVVMVSP